MKSLFLSLGIVLLYGSKVMHSPVMLVLRREAAFLFKDNQGLRGLRCRWFTDSGLMQEAVQYKGFN